MGYVLEEKLQPKLDGARPSGAEHRIGRSDVGSGATATERANGWISRCADALACGPTERIREVGMIGDVEHLGPELRSEPLAELPALGN